MTVEEGVRGGDLYREAGIEVAAFFIVGYPGETVADIEKTLSLALALPLDEISFNVPMPLPGSPLYERLGGSDEGRDWTHENELTFVFASDIDEDWLRRRIDETMAAFAAKRTTPPDAGGAAPGGPRAAAAAPRQRRRRNRASVGAREEPEGGGAEAPEPPPHLELPPVP